MAEKELQIKISQNGAERVQAALGGLDGGMKGVARTAAGMAAGYFSAQGVLNALKYSVEQSRQGEAAAVKLSTAYGRNTKALIDFANQRQRMTKFDDDGTVAAMAAIAAFTKEEGAVKALTVAAQDLAEAKGMDLVSAAELLGRTFGTSTNALKRSGIEVDANAGSMDRLRQITEGVANLYGGQATEAAKTLEGQFIQTQNAIDNTAQSLGDALAPAIKAALPEIQGMAETWGDVISDGGDARDILAGIGDKLLWLSPPLKLAVELMKRMKDEGIDGLRKKLEDELGGAAIPKTILQIRRLSQELSGRGLKDAADAANEYANALELQQKTAMEGITVSAKSGAATKEQTEEQKAAAKAATDAAAAAKALRDEYWLSEKPLFMQIAHYEQLRDTTKDVVEQARAEIEVMKLRRQMVDEKFAAAPDMPDISDAALNGLIDSEKIDNGTESMKKFGKELSQAALEAMETAAAQDALEFATLSGTANMIGAFAGLNQAMNGNAVASKRMAQASAIIDTYAGANKAFAQGGVLGFITGAAIIAQGLANVAMMEKQQFASGGFVRGHGGGRSDMVPANLSAGEGVLTASTVARIGGEAAVNALNAGGGTGGGIVINFTGPVTDRAFVRDYIVPEVRRAVGRGMA